jgi:2-(1,2-epoxy-1,2-dihydrophenyl)acetyl-CoA isomerase
MAFTMLGETWSAGQAQASGMIWRAVEDDQFAAEVDAVAGRLSAAPTHGLGCAKRALHAGWSSTLDEALDLERDLQRACGRSEDYKEGVTAFKQKRAAQFGGR